ncbi:MAG: hypothetical protein ABJB86_20985 [Bacteroidota bacterium]
MYARLSLVFLFVALFTNIDIRAQAAHPEIRQVLPEKGIYRFPLFNDGTIVFRNGNISAVKLNYNITLDEMHFISDTGDTLSIAEPALVNFISSNGSRFYYNKGYLQAIDSANDIILAFKQVLSIQQLRPAAYGTTEPHEGLRNYSFYTGNGQTVRLGEEEKIKVTSHDIYYFGDAYGHFSKAGKEFIFGHFEKQHEAVSEFIKTNHINFNVLKDLSKMMAFCRGLK